MPKARIVRIYLVRHGESEGNVGEPIFCGRTNPPLTGRGLEQASALGDWLRTIETQVVCSSTRIRASKTAQLMAGLAGHIPQLSYWEEFNEISYGDWEGRTLAEAKKIAPHTFDQWEIDRTPPPKGETLVDVAKRARLGVDLLLDQTTQAVVVTHLGVIRALVGSIFLEDPYWHRSIQAPLASVTTLEFTINGPIVTPNLLGLGLTSHLPKSLRG
jgi:phosphoserine phosphatase